MKQVEDEYLDIVNEKDQVIGKKLRSDVYEKELSNFRAVNVFIKNSKGELWIPKRTAHKRIFPLSLDFSMGEHVTSGETYEQAFRRGLKEELNIDIEKIKYHLLGYLTPKKGVASYQNVYEINSEEVPDYNKNDFIEYYWLKPEEVLQRIEKGEKAKGDLPKLIKYFYLNHSTDY